MHFHEASGGAMIPASRTHRWLWFTTVASMLAAGITSIFIRNRRDGRHASLRSDQTLTVDDSPIFVACATPSATDIQTIDDAFSHAC